MMKKLHILITLPILLAGCGESEELGYKDWSIVSPTGAPSIALAAFCDTPNFQTNSDASNIVAMMKAGQADIAVLPLNAGIQAIRQGKLPYKYGATLTKGNLYIASTGNDDNGTMDADDYIVSFQKGAVPDKIFHYVFGDAYENALNYVSNAQEAAKCLKLGKNLADDGKAVDYVLLAEPALTTVLESSPNRTQYADLQELYKVKSGGLSFCQAALFVKNELAETDEYKVQFMNKLNSSISEMNKGDGASIELMNSISNPEVTYGVKPEVADKLFKNGNRMNINTEATLEEINMSLSIFGLDPLTNEEIA